MNRSDFKIVQNKDYPRIGRCVFCEARDYCGKNFSCECTMREHYKDIKKERRLKIQKIENHITK